MIEPANEVISNSHDGIGIRGVDEVGVVVMPLESFLSLEWLSKEEWEVTLPVQIKVGREVCLGDSANGGEPIDGAGGCGDHGVGFDPGRPVGDPGSADGSVPETILVSTVGRGCAVVAILVGFSEFGRTVIRGEEDECVFVELEIFERLMNEADLLVDIGDGGEVDGFVFVLRDRPVVLSGDFLGRIDIPMRFVKVDKLDEGLGGVAFFREPASSFRTNDIGGKAGFGSFGFSVADPAGFVADLRVVIRSEPVVETVVFHRGDVIGSLFGSFHLNGHQGVVPFPDVGGLVAVLFEELGNGHR